jgi:hypothetical protein
MCIHALKIIAAVLMLMYCDELKILEAMNQMNIRNYYYYYYYYYLMILLIMAIGLFVRGILQMVCDW